MDIFGLVLSSVQSIFSIPFMLYGFSFSFWQVFLWSIVATIALWAVFKILEG